MVRRLSVYEAESTDPYRNLAVEEYLTYHVQPSECVLYLWQNQRTVVIGKNQNAWKECNIELLEAEGGHLARRTSGGGAVFHDLGNLNFSFCVREEDYSVERQSEVILRAVKSLGIPAQRTGRNDIVADGRKFSGNAFLKSKGCCCHHGTLLIGVDQQQMGRYLNVSPEKLRAKGVDSVRARTVNLRELLPGLEVAQMKEALLRSFSEVYGAGCADAETENQAFSPLFADRLDWEEIAQYERRLSSWEWKYGRKIPFEYTVSQRFPWGGIELCFHVNGGVIQEIKVYSDAMQEQLARRLEECMKGCAYRRDALLARLKEARLDRENEEANRQIRSDIGRLILREVMK